MKEILITSSVLIAVLLLLRVIFAKKVNRVLIYGAWGLVALRLLIPVQIGQLDFSILTSAKPVTEAITEVSNKQVAGVTEQDAYREIIKDYVEKDQTVFTPEVQEHIQSALRDEMPKEEIAVMIDKVYAEQEVFAPEVQQQVQQQVEETAEPITLGQIATIVWLFGVAVMAVWFVVVNLRHSRMLRKNREKLDCDSTIPVYVSEKVGSPCLAGLFRPTIYLTPECAASEETQRHVLTHELTHYAHKDHIWSVVRCVCLCVYWFNPLVWVAAWFSRRDCELASDEGALKRLGPEERIAYGRSLLDVVSHASTPAHLMETATAMNETKKQLKERVNFIVKKPKISLIAAICMVLVCAIVAGCAAAGPANGENLATPTNPTTPTTQPSEPSQPEKTTKMITLLVRSVSDTEGSSHYEEIVPHYDDQWNLTGYTYDRGATTNTERYLEVNAQGRKVVVYNERNKMIEEYYYREDGKLGIYKGYESDRLTRYEEYTYDEAGRLTETMLERYGTHSDQTLYDRFTNHYEYDEKGNLLSHTYAKRTIGVGDEWPEDLLSISRYTYDERGLPVRQDYYQSGTQLLHYITYTYDLEARTVTEMKYSERDMLEKETTTRYDEEGRVVEITEKETFGNHVTTTTYTYQTVEVPLDFFAPDYFKIPMAKVKFWE